MNHQISSPSESAVCRPAGGLPALQVTLQLAVHHHNFGQLQEAARLYCEVLHSQPCLLYTSPSPRDRQKSRMPSSA